MISRKASHRSFSLCTGAIALAAFCTIVSGCAGPTSIALAAIRNDVERIDSLVEKGRDANKPEPGGSYPIEFATILGNVEATKALLDHGVDVNFRNPQGRTPLFHIARKGEFEHPANKGKRKAMAEFLLANGADPDIPDYFGMTPFLVAAANGNREMLEVLLDHGAMTGGRDSLGRNGRDLAAESGHSGIEEMLAVLGLERTEFPPIAEPKDAAPLPVGDCFDQPRRLIKSTSRLWCGMPYEEFVRDTGVQFAIGKYKTRHLDSAGPEGKPGLDEPDCSIGPGPENLELAGLLHRGSGRSGDLIGHTETYYAEGNRVAEISFVFDRYRRVFGVRCFPVSVPIWGDPDLLY